MSSKKSFKAKSRRRLRILVANDDGVHAPGLHILAQELRKIAEVTVVAPMDEKSTTGHSLTLHKPLRLNEMSKGVYGVSGSPADCVYLGIREVMSEMPDLVVSGINRGANLGQDIYYSGTVSAAREACMLGIPAIAASLAVNFNKINKESDLHFVSAAKIVRKIILTGVVETLNKHTLLNINVPNLPLSRIQGIRTARQGFRYYSGEILKRKDHRGRDYFWVGGEYKGFQEVDGTDCTLVDRRFATLTPLQLDCTDAPSLAILSSVFTI